MSIIHTANNSKILTNIYKAQESDEVRVKLRANYQARCNLQAETGSARMGAGVGNGASSHGTQSQCVYAPGAEQQYEFMAGSSRVALV